MRRIAIVLVSLLSIGAAARCQESFIGAKVFVPGEELRYKVKWTFFRLGTVTLKTVIDSSCHGANEIKLVMTVESNPDLSFVWIREFNESVVDESTSLSKRFHARHRNGETYLELWHEFDQSLRRATWRMVDKNTGAQLQADTLSGVPSYVEGPSLFFYTRCISHRTGTMMIPTLVEGKIAPTDLSFDAATENQEIDAIRYPLRVRKFTGVAHWQGGTEAGLSGAFSGWISDDDAAVPLVAEVKVILGSIRLELESWTRPGWVPPSAEPLQASSTLETSTR